MCGLVAAISKGNQGFEYKADLVFTQMLYANALRGMDSTGLYGINKHGNLDMLKSAQPSADFIRTPEAREFIDKIYMNYRIVVGHNRAATKGAVKDENAHPFIENNICLVHNGTLYNHKQLKDVDVDSHAITHALAEGKAEDVIPSLDGAFALIWYDAAKKKLFITRNNERPLYLVETEKTDYIASEDSMLEWLLSRNGHAKVTAKYFKPFHLYSYDLDKLSEGFDVEELQEKKLLPVVERAVPLRLVSQSQPHGTKSSEKCFYKFYKYGDVIPLEWKRTQYSGDLVIMHGITLDSTETAWSYACKANAYDNYTGVDSFLGTTTGVSYKDGKATLIMGSLKPEQYHVSCNDVCVSELEVMNHNDGCCDLCNSIIDFDTEQFWVRYKGGQLKTVHCESCVSKNGNLKHFLEKAKNDTTM
jgi:predicted glutamine amidotransferase